MDTKMFVLERVRFRLDFRNLTRRVSQITSIMDMDIADMNDFNEVSVSIMASERLFYQS